MKICHYLEFQDSISGGIRESVRHQRKALESKDVEYTTDPELDVDILHLNVMGPRSIYLAKKARKKGIPVVIHTHVTAEDFGQSFRFSSILAKPLKPYLRYAYSLGDLLLCPSEYNQGLISGYTDSKSEVISNGVDSEKLEGFEELREEYLERFDLEPPVVFNVGHVFKRKGLRDFVKTAEEMPELDFAWFGPLDLKMKDRETRKLVENSPENCIFTGFIDDIRGGFAAGDIFFFPTYEENEGIALLEALYCGKPVLVRGIDVFDWLEDGGNCLKSEDGFEKQLNRLSDEELREDLGRAAEETGRGFRLEIIGNRLLELYSDLI